MSATSSDALRNHSPSIAAWISRSSSISRRSVMSRPIPSIAGAPLPPSTSRSQSSNQRALRRDAVREHLERLGRRIACLRRCTHARSATRCSRSRLASNEPPIHCAASSIARPPIRSSSASGAPAASPRNTSG
jgi:hypothetical protein